jgi:hypothetical protein
MRSFFIKMLILVPMLVGLPLLGLTCAGIDLRPYLHVPPLTAEAQHAPFSWIGVAIVAGLALAVVGPFIRRVLRAWPGTVPEAPRGAFPWWGRFALGAGMLVWILAWTRFSWFAPWQLHTFTPLWLAYIAVVNALTYRRTGRCMMCHRPMFFLTLFPLSAMFWWFFEYLNRFVQNWYYVGAVNQMSSLEYILFATLPFATVLPAVLGTQELLQSFPLYSRAFESVPARPVRRPRVVGGVLLALSAAGLAGIGRVPDLLFPLLWVSPLFILVGLQACLGEKSLLDDAAGARWTRIATAAVAALVCGFFWEMWNVASLAKWKYAIPYVHAAPVFEMPILGYLGYLPFGLECLVIGDLARGILERTGERAEEAAALEPALRAGMNPF